MISYPCVVGKAFHECAVAKEQIGQKEGEEDQKVVPWRELDQKRRIRIRNEMCSEDGGDGKGNRQHEEGNRNEEEELPVPEDVIAKVELEESHGEIEKPEMIKHFETEHRYRIRIFEIVAGEGGKSRAAEAKDRDGKGIRPITFSILGIADLFQLLLIEETVIKVLWFQRSPFHIL